MIVFGRNVIKWEDFIKQLEPEEIEVYSHIRFYAQQTEEPQEIQFEGITIGLLWPSGSFQPAYRIPDGQPITLKSFLDGATL